MGGGGINKYKSMTLRDSDDVPAFSAPSGRIRDVGTRRSRSKSPSAAASLSGLVARLRGGDGDGDSSGDEAIEFSGPAERRPSASSLDAAAGFVEAELSSGGRANRRPSGGSLGGLSHPGMVGSGRARDLYVAGASSYSPQIYGSGGPVAAAGARSRSMDHTYGAGASLGGAAAPHKAFAKSVTSAGAANRKSFIKSMMQSISLLGGHDCDDDDTPPDRIAAPPAYEPNLAPLTYRRHSPEGTDEHQRWETRSHSSESSSRSRGSSRSYDSTDSVAVRFTKRVTAITAVAVCLTAVFASFFVLSKNKALLGMSARTASDMGTVSSSAAGAGGGDGTHVTLSGAAPGGPQFAPEMPFPPSANGQSYAYSLPRSMTHLADTSTPQRRSEETPVLMHVPMVGGVPEGVAVRCLGLVGAVSSGDGKEWEGKPLEVIKRNDGHSYVNVDMLTPDGISRASSLQLAPSRMAHFVSTPLLHVTSGLVFDSVHQGRLFVLLRHPIERAVASYRHMVQNDPYNSQMTLEEYATGPYAEGDWVTRFLSDHSSGPVTESHAAMAKEVLRRKAVVGLYDEMDDSLRRMKAYFGWDAPQVEKGGAEAGEEQYMRCQRQVLAGHGGGGDGGQQPAPEVLKSRSHDGMVLREGDSAYAALAERNRYDMELYRYARQLFAVQADLPLNVAEEVSPEEEAGRWPPNRNCVENGRFRADPPLNNWYAVRSTLQAVPGVEGTALQSFGREHQVFGGMWQNLQADCLKVGEWYEVKATVRATMAGSDESFRCDPTVLFNNDATSCPGIGLRTGEDIREVAYAVGPIRDDQDWFQLHGAFEATSDMLAKRLSLFVSRAPPNVDIAVDSVEVTPVPREKEKEAGIASDCSNPVANGDAETGDHRRWFVRGPAGAGRIEVFSPGYGKSKYAFRHVGPREDRWRGMLQSLDTSCFSEGTQWSISARFKYYRVDNVGTAEESLVPVSCRKDNPRAERSCPVFALDFLSREGDIVTTGPLVNEAPGENVKVGGWNEVRHRFTVTAEMALRPQALLYVNSVDPGHTYELDAVEMTPL